VLSSFSEISPLDRLLFPQRSNGLGGIRLGLGRAWSLSFEKLESASAKCIRSSFRLVPAGGRLRSKYEKSASEVDGVSKGDDVAEGVPGGEGKEEEAVNDGVDTGDAWSSSEGGSEPEVHSEGVDSVGRRGRNLNLSPNRFVGVAGDCGLIGDWAISLAWPPAD
jgi:hypothetical protein